VTADSSGGSGGNPGGLSPGAPGAPGEYLGGLFPGGTSVSHLTVYDWSSPDGHRGGSAHAHLACTEGYVVIGGKGRLQTLGYGGYAETPLTPLTVAWFSPGVIHRLVNEQELKIIVVMQNGGLPEAGDCVLTFPPERLADAQAYREVAALGSSPGTGEEAAAARNSPGRGDEFPALRSSPATGAPPMGDSGTADRREAPAERRKNLAVAGFLRLRARVETEGPQVLDEFYAAATALVRPQLPAWRQTWETGALAAAQRTLEQLDALERGEVSYLHDGRLTVLSPPEERRLGMCGRLATYEPARVTARPARAPGEPGAAQTPPGPSR